MRLHKDRLLWAGLAVLLLGLVVYLLRETGGAGWMPGCVFREATGYDCPGCGMTRATHALLHGEVAAAFRFNAVGLVLLPVLLFGLLLEVVGWVRGRPFKYRFPIGKRVSIALGVVLVLWWVLRNVFWKL